MSANRLALTNIDVHTYETGKTRLTGGCTSLRVIGIVFLENLIMQTNISEQRMLFFFQMS
jgi:hypothetical protein